MAYGLATSLSSLDSYLQITNSHGLNQAGVIGCDTETEGLNVLRDKMVGISISLEPETALYLPVGHTSIHENLPLDRVVERLRNHAEQSGYWTTYYNGPFDRNFFEVYGEWVPQKWVDALELVYLENPDRQRKDLKTVAKADLKFDMARFETLFDEDEVKNKSYNIARKAPSDVTDYACADADAALRLVIAKQATWDEFEFIVTVDTQLADILREMHRLGGMELNLPYISQCREELDLRMEAFQQQVWRMAGCDFDINSPKQVGEILYEHLGLPVLAKTGSGKPSTNAETLDKLAKQNPIVEAIVCFRKVYKARNTYFEKLDRLQRLERPVRFNFNQYHVPTFRLSAPGGDPERDGATGVNIQAVSNGEARAMLAVDLLAEGSADAYINDVDEDEILVDLSDEGVGDATEDGPISHRELLSLPYVVSTEPQNDGDPDGLACFRETCRDCPALCADRGIDTTRRTVRGLRVVPSVRQAFKVPDDFSLVSLDYDRQELVIAANLSQEPKWVKALGQGEDLHAITAMGAYQLGEDEWNALAKRDKKDRRNIGKMLNFATLYGATAHTLASRAGIPVDQAEEIYEGFRAAYPTLFSWITTVHNWARNHGYTTTYFGRKRWLKQFYKLNDKKQAAFADRSAVNTAIQGTGADVTRIAMVKAKNNFRKEGITRAEAYCVMQVHDELSFAIRTSMIDDILPVIKRSMEFHVAKWAVQLTVGHKIGTIWGAQE